MKKFILETLRQLMGVLLAAAVFGVLFAQWIWIIANPVCAKEVEEVKEVDEWFMPDTATDVVWTSESDSGLDISGEVSEIDAKAFIASIDPQTHYETLYMDSHGATAYGWEITEAIRLVMLESGAESDIDIREHCALICKQLLYCQTVGGWDDWGTTLWGIIHSSHTYNQTSPRIWTADAIPTDRVTEIFWDVWLNGYFTDFRVQCFRSTCYHTWAIPAYQIDKTFYSINPWQDFSMFDLDVDGVLKY